VRLDPQQVNNNSSEARHLYEAISALNRENYNLRKTIERYQAFHSHFQYELGDLCREWEKIYQDYEPQDDKEV